MKKILIFIYIATLLCSIKQVYANMSVTQFNQAFSQSRFVKPKSSELRLVSQAYKQVLLNQPSEKLWSSLAMQSIVEQNVISIAETVDFRQGKGFFKVNTGLDIKPWLLQAPHAKSDLYSGKIVEKLFAEAAVKAAMWNTVSRKTLVENVLGENKADMSHLTGTYWQAVTERFAQHYKQGKVIQLHGYAQSKRKTRAGKESDMIISAGHKNPPFWVRQFVQCLQKQLPGKISLYPYDVKELGGTTNVQAQLLKNQGFDGFVHIEMSKPMREKLLHSQNLRKLFLACFESLN